MLQFIIILIAVISVNITYGKLGLETRYLINSIRDSTKNVEVGITKFSNITNQEFKNTYLMPRRKYPKFAGSRYFKNDDIDRIVSDRTNIPTSFDWRDYGVVSPVKDQGQSGTCWSFCTTGNIESQWKIAKNQTVLLSEQFLVDCDYTNCGGEGGLPDSAFQYVMKVGGLPAAEVQPYCIGLKEGACKPCVYDYGNKCTVPRDTCDESRKKLCPPTTSLKPAAKITTWTSISTNENQIVEALYQLGPLIAGLDANLLQYYKGGIWDPVVAGTYSCSASEMDHVVLLVGYGVSPNGVPYWIAKNSWGADWGEQGYFKIRRGVGTCGINSYVLTSCVGTCSQVVQKVQELRSKH